MKGYKMAKKSSKKKKTLKKGLLPKLMQPKALLLIVFIVFFALIGAYYLTRSKAETGSGGKGHFCWVIQSDHTVKCWGRNWEGQIGNGEDRNTCLEKYNNKIYTEEQYRLCAFPSTPTKSLIDNVRSVTAGFKNTCAVKFDNTLWCWGQNTYGQVDPTSSNTTINTPKQIASLTNVKKVTFPVSGANGMATCALKNDGTVWCWGWNGSGDYWAGYLGLDKTISTITSPQQVPNIDNVTDLVAGGAHICALKNDATVWCWGSNASGEAGIGVTGNPITTPTKSGMTGAIKISAGYDNTCAVKADLTLWCWGSNNLGKLGVKAPKTTRKNTVGFVGTPNPMQVPGISNVKDISSGTDYNCATKTDLTLWCWGDNISGQLGRGTKWLTDSSGQLVPNSDEYIPAAVTGFTNTAQVATTYRSTCASQANGNLYCWGWDEYRQLGQGGVFDDIYIEIVPAQTSHDKLVPTLVPNINVN